MTDSIAFFISSIGGLCKKTKMPGTVASFMALIFSVLSYYFLGKIIYVFLFLIFLILAFWAVKKVQKKNGIGDHQWIGVDEWIGVWFANFFLFETNLNLTQIIVFSFLSFLIFRIIDIFKFIPPLNTINKDKNQGVMAVVLDDFIGGYYTYFIMLIILGIYDFKFLYFSFLILLPPMIANMTPTLLKMKYWNRPIDEKLFGKNKTWRGFLGAIVVGTLSFFVLVKLNLVIFPNELIYIILVGFLFSFGAIGGDLVESFLKRRIGINAGESWIPWDQIDYILGMIILTYPIYQYSFNQIIFLIALGGIISALTHRIGYLMKINTAKQ